MHVEVAPGQQLEEGLSIEVDLLEVLIFLVINVGICESMLGQEGTLWRQ